MITCYVRYVIDPKKLDVFETYANMWIPLVQKFGGQHHGYFLPAEGANNIALALFSFESLSAYDNYRTLSLHDEECLKAFEFAEQADCIISYERSFFRPLLGPEAH
ncbi:NIPSNAP family protein [Celerinatantimonas sp. YJH-8]|uniref:NIPSNAP family protein n=1 Tax=Celerinatantimonas sp. YJH-8 TaxID=3228714 RepID=UPI0038C7E8BE